MSELKDKPQQQILFEEITPSQEKSNLANLEEQVIFENDDLTEIDSNEHFIPKDKVLKKPKWLWRTASALFLFLVGFEVVEFFILGFEQQPIIASIYGALLLVLFLITGGSILKEYRGLRQFKRRQKLQKDIDKSLHLESNISAQQLCQEITEQLPCDLLTAEGQQWDESIQSELSDAEVLRLYSRQILTKVDQKALDKVSKYSTESVVLVALSPIAIVDMMLMLWRNLKMVDEIAHLYGLKLSYWSRIKLIKQVFINMVFAGATELIADVGADLLGADLLGKLSSRLAQGLGAGMLTARLGLKTMHLCRPIPFDESSPKLKDVRKKLVEQIKALSMNKKS